MSGSLRLMLLAAAALAALLVYDRTSGPGPAPDPGGPAPLVSPDAAPGPTAGTTADTAPAPAAAALNPLAALPPERLADLRDRPLFSPSRRGVAAPAAQTGAPMVMAPVAPAMETPSAGPKPVLLGTVSSPAPGGVFLGDDQGGPIDFVVPGAESHGLRLLTVRPESATFSGPEGEVDLQLPQLITPDSNG